MKSTLILALLLACGAAQASEWVSIGEGNDHQSEIYIDNTSVRIKGAVRSVSIKITYAPNTLKGPADDKYKWVKEFTKRQSFNCTEATFLTDSAALYFYDGTRSQSPADTLSTTYKPVPPDTVTSVVMRYICAWKPD